VTGDSATVSWQPPLLGTVARYQVEAHLVPYDSNVWPDFGTRIVGGSTTSITWGALPLNNPVYFTVAPVGPDGAGYASGPMGPFTASGTVTATNSDCPTTTSGDCVVVDTTNGLGPETRPGAGLLNGEVPPGNPWVGALNLTHWRIQGVDSADPQTVTRYDDVTAIVPPQNVIEDLGADWLADHAQGGLAVDPWNNWTTYSAFIASIVRADEQAGENPIWEIENEPENYPYSTASPPTRALVEQQYLLAYQAIKGVDPNARVIGPSIDWQYEDSAAPWYLDIKTFIPFAAANGMKLYAFAWHENADIKAQNPLVWSETPGVLTDEAEEIRELLAEYPGIGSPKLFVDENSSASGYFIPGFQAGYVAAEDQAGVDEGNRSCWRVPGTSDTNTCFEPNLGGLLNSDGNPNPNYWVMADYGQMSGTRVSSEESDVNVSALAVTDASGTTRVLLGRHQTCSQPTTGSYCSGPKNLAAAVPATVQVVVPPSAASASVGIQEIPNSLADTTTAPATTTESVPVSNGLASISIPSFGDGEAYFLTVTPVFPKPTVASVTPSSGSTAGGTSVTITGTGLSGATAVNFGTTAAASFTVTSGTQINAVSPAHGAGAVDVTVATPGGTSATGSADPFSYVVPAPTVTSVAPASGLTTGGTSVTINGTGFTGATAVSFGTTPATSFTVTSDSQITAVSPTGSAGAVDVTVSTPGGTSATGSADQFTYLAPPPTVTSVAPASGLTTGGTSVTINGSSVAGATAVNFGGVPATSFIVTSDSQLMAVSPVHGAGAVDVTVTTPGGTSATGSADQFSYVVPPATVASVSPNSGTTAGGSSVTINGAGFTGATAVSFGATPATSFTVTSDSQITAVSPAGLAGAVDVTVTTPGGTSAISSSDTYTYVAPIVKQAPVPDGFTNGGKTELSVFRPSNGQWYLKDSLTGTTTSAGFGITGDVPVPGDYDGDGKTDMAVFRPSNDNWYIKLSGGGTETVGFGISGDIPVPGDYDGDGKTDIAVFRPSNGTWHILDSTTGKAVTVGFGISGDIPVPGDYDGDGKTDIAVFRPSNDTWYIKLSGGGTETVGFGASGDIPVPGDYDGDGKTDIAVFRPSNGTWHILDSTTGKAVTVGFGISGDIPVPGDYDGDGKTDIAVFRPSSDRWYIDPSSTGVSTNTGFGISGDEPTIVPPAIWGQFFS
jgi:hypothetical protein